VDFSNRSQALQRFYHVRMILLDQARVLFLHSISNLRWNTVDIPVYRCILPPASLWSLFEMDHPLQESSWRSPGKDSRKSGEPTRTVYPRSSTTSVRIPLHMQTPTHFAPFSRFASDGVRRPWVIQYWNTSREIRNTYICLL